MLLVIHYGAALQPATSLLSSPVSTRAMRQGSADGRST